MGMILVYFQKKNYLWEADDDVESLDGDKEGPRRLKNSRLNLSRRRSSFLGKISEKLGRSKHAGPQSMSKL